MSIKKILVSCFVGVFFFNFFVSSASAAVEYPPLTEEMKQYEYYAIYSMNKTGSSPIFIGSDTPMAIDSNWRLTAGYKYELNSAGQWYKSHPSPLEMNISTQRGDTFWYSSNDIYRGGELFFAKKLLPQPAIVEEAIQTVQLGAVMKIIKEVAPIVVLSIVSFLGLRKAWRFCLSQLKSS